MHTSCIFQVQVNSEDRDLIGSSCLNFRIVEPTVWKCGNRHECYMESFLFMECENILKSTDQAVSTRGLQSYLGRFLFIYPQKIIVSQISVKHLT